MCDCLFNPLKYASVKDWKICSEKKSINVMSGAGIMFKETEDCFLKGIPEQL